MNNVGSTTLSHAVFNNLEQVITFCRVVVELSSYMLKVPNIAAVDSQCLRFAMLALA